MSKVNLSGGEPAGVKEDPYFWARVRLNPTAFDAMDARTVAAALAFERLPPQEKQQWETLVQTLTQASAHASAVDSLASSREAARIAFEMAERVSQVGEVLLPGRAYGTDDSTECGLYEAQQLILKSLAAVGLTTSRPGVAEGFAAAIGWLLIESPVNLMVPQGGPLEAADEALAAVDRARSGRPLREFAGQPNETSTTPPPPVLGMAPEAAGDRPAGMVAVRAKSLESLSGLAEDLFDSWAVLQSLQARLDGCAGTVVSDEDTSEMVRVMGLVSRRIYAAASVVFDADDIAGASK
jgi:hypothetical protein